MTTSVLNRLAGIATLTLVLGLGASACAKKKPPVTPPPPVPPTVPAAPRQPPPPPPPAVPPTPTRTESEEDIFARSSVADVQRNLETVYFNLDDSSLGDAAKASLTKNATYLKRWTSIIFTVEGHCDERGTAEYNLGLGERRAAAVKDYLVSLGVPANRITTVSKGKESPVCTDHNEACWQQNRRGQFIVTAK